MQSNRFLELFCYQREWDSLTRAGTCGCYPVRHPTWFIAVVLIAAGCNNSGKPVLFVLPADFRGEFRIVKDSVGGVELVERNGEYVFEIPPSGVLRVKNDRPFYRWHVERAPYLDGRVVEIEGIGSAAGYNPGKGGSSTEYDGTTHAWRVR